MQTWTAVTYERSHLSIGGRERVCKRRFSCQLLVASCQSEVRRPQPLASDPYSAIRNGFTLLELSVVLFIIALFFTLTVPRLSYFSGNETQASARRLSALVRYLSNEAAVSGRPYRLHYDLDQGTYWVTVFTATREIGEFLPDESPLSRRVQLPSTVAFLDIFIPGSGRVDSGQVFTHFYPQGYTDPTIIHLRDQYAQVTTVTIPPLTGEAWITNGYTDGFLPRRQER